jgi:transposase-like protein
MLDAVPTVPVTELFQLIVLLAWTCLQLSTRKNAIFDTVFPNMSVITGLMASTSSACCPGLFNMLQSSTPPTLSQLKTLPSDFSKRWGIYLLVLEKAGCIPRVYIGSGTRQVGVYYRMRDYETRNSLPSTVAASLKEGYVITHKGLLLWAPIPAAEDLPLFRALFILLEASMCCAFWAVMEKKMGGAYSFGIHELCSWRIKDLEYAGLCTHSSLVEQLHVDFALSAEDLKALEQSRRVATRARTNKSHANQRATNIKTKRYHCATCNATFGMKEHYDIHMASKLHLQKAGGIPNTKYQNDHARAHTKNLETKRYPCKPCGSHFVTATVLKKHLPTKHLEAVRSSLSSS